MDQPTYYIETIGCQMNERDAETIAGILDGLGLYPVLAPADARVIVVNTCSVRRKPEEKTYSRLGEWRLLKEADPKRIIAICGCTPQVSTQEVLDHAPFADIVMGPRGLGDFRQAVVDCLDGKADGMQVFVDNAEHLPEALPARRSAAISAYVNITYGCDNWCAYCVVPTARGGEISRNPGSVLAECREAISSGCVEICLLGQNVNSYGHQLEPPMGFAELLIEVGSLPGLQRLRFTTSHPKDLSEHVLDTMSIVPTICEHLHLPIQSGDDEVLARMGRGYTFERYLRIIDRARELMPSISITTDVMVGFPGETDEQFRNTLAAFERIRYDQAFMFKYNDRPGTASSEMDDKVPEEIKQRRLGELIRLQNDTSRAINEKAVGRAFEVLVEGLDRKTTSAVRGRTRQNKLMIFPGSAHLIGRTVTVQATEAYLWGHKGELLSPA